MQTRSRAIFFLFALLVSLLGGIVNHTPARAAGVVLFVSRYGDWGTASCFSWTNACALQKAITKASSGDQIWVEQGTYIPDPSDRNASFLLKNGVALYGGFTGTETQLSQRNPGVNVTVLSGDLNSDDVGFTNNEENSHHVVVSDGAGSSTILDGFTILGGNANGSQNDVGGGLYNINLGSPTLINVKFTGNSAGWGGGMYNVGGSPILTNVIFTGNSALDGAGIYNDGGSPRLTNVIFSENSSSYDGGGMSNNSSNPTLTNVTFSGNSAYNFGGGIYNSISSPILNNVTFSDNYASSLGGGMINLNSNPTLTNVTFSGNSSYEDGGGMYSTSSTLTLTNVTFSGNFSEFYGGGAMYNSESNLTLTNVTFSGNSGDYGGGMYNFSGSLALTNVTFSSNSAYSGAGMYNNNSSPILINTIIADSVNGGDCGGSTFNISSFNNLIEDTSNACGLTNGVNGNIVGADPKLGPLANNGGLTQTHALLTGSPAINTGRNASCPTTDQRGVIRPWGGYCDMGAYEFAIRTITGNTSIANVKLSYTNGPAPIISQWNGSYSIAVPSGWSGTITPSHLCFTFSPANRTYSYVPANQTAQNFSPTFTPASGCAAVSVKIKTTTQGTYGLPATSGDRLSYKVDSGPLFVNSPNSKPFVASERMIFPKGSNNPTHFSELMGLPAHLKSTRYSFPAYDNLFFNSQLRFANVGTANTTVIVTVAGVEKGRYNLAPNQSMKVSYPNLSSGPVVVQSTGNVPIIAALRVVPLTYNGSFSEMMGVPQSQVATSYVFPWYNNVDLNTQLRFANVGTATTTVTVTIGGVPRGNFTLAPNASQRVSFPNVNSGPVRVTSSGNVPIVASMRVAFRSGNTWTGFSELLGLPQSQMNTTYHFPWYNNVTLNTQLRFANMSGSTATVHVYIGGQEPTGSPFNLAAGASTRKSFAANNGPVKVVSNQIIVASLRVQFQNSNSVTSFSELMGLPQSQLATSYLFPWYNNIGIDTQLRIGVP